MVVSTTWTNHSRWPTDEAGREGSMIQLIILLAMLVRYEQNKYVPPASEYVSPHEWQAEEVKFTYYIWTGNKTASGVYPIIGMCASNREHLGDIAALYDKDKDFIGYFEATDTGGTEGLKKGYVIDVFAYDMETVYKFAEEYGTEGYVLWVKGEG